MVQLGLMRILVIGSGGREHAICWKFSQSSHTKALYCAPGNAGIADLATCLPVNVNDPQAIAELAASIGADLTFIGPEAPLVAGVAEACAARNLRVVAPSQTAAQLEGSKIFAKQFMSSHSIPTAPFSVCTSIDEAREAVHAYSYPIVIKADGLAAGKGVRLVENRAEFNSVIDAMMSERIFGDAGERVVIEECLVGREASLMIFTDGYDYKTIAPAQDYKRAFDNDQGLNTGGMGSFSTDHLIEDTLLERCRRDIIEPTLAGLTAEGNPFRGILYAGLMFTEDGPKVIEFNARMGDPETQTVLMRLDSDLVEICTAIIDGSIGSLAVRWSADASVCVVAAAGGYPGDFERGHIISGLAAASQVEGVTIFHAGTSRDAAGNFITAGGRVLGVTARGATVGEARAQAYAAIDQIDFEKMHYRRDIATQNG